MANTEKVIINVSPDTFAIDGIEINVKDDSNVDITTAADRFKIVGVGTNDAMAGIYDITSRPARELLKRALDLILAGEENLIYRIDTSGSSDTDKTLAEITAEPLLHHQYSALLLHDPIYRCYVQTLSDRSDHNLVYYRYADPSGTDLDLSPSYKGDSLSSVKASIESLGLSESEGAAYKAIAAGVDKAGIVLEKYHIEITYDSGAATANNARYSGVVTPIRVPLYELPELEMCIPVVAKS